MLPDLCHISREDILALEISPKAMRQAMAEIFADVQSGDCLYLPKSQLGIGVGHSFQSMVASSKRHAKAMVKWVGVAPVTAGATLPGISAVICLNDLTSGHPLALMDGEIITLQRTAAMSAHAAGLLAADAPRSIGLVGCGGQAQSHLAAMLDLFPSIAEVICYSRSAASAQRLADLALAKGLNGVVEADPDALLAASDLVVSMVPMAAGLRPILDARKMRPNATAIMVDLGRSWHPEGLVAFEQIVTDSLDQMVHPMNAEGGYSTSVTMSQDLITGFERKAGRQAFCFKGHAAGDLAAAALVYDLALLRGMGTKLLR